MIKPRDISGLADYTEAENAALSRWIRIVEDTYELYGFSRLTPRPLELRELLLPRGGIQKQVFGVSRLPNDVSTDLALPFDRTVPLAIWIAKHASTIVFPYKRYDISYSFRGERAQAGRFQVFFQADVDIVGSDCLDLSADTDCIAVISTALSCLGVGRFTVCLSHVPVAAELLRLAGLPAEAIDEALRLVDKLGKTDRRGIVTEFQQRWGLRLDQTEALLDLFCFTGTPERFLARAPLQSDVIQKGVTELQTVWDGLVAQGVPEDSLSFWPRNVRGLDYYSGVVFETFLVGRESIGSIASGGRYDDLASTFSSRRLPGAGGSIGLTRLFDAACRGALVEFGQRTVSEVFVGYRLPEFRILAHQIAGRFRGFGIRVDVYAGQTSVGKQLTYASRKGIPTAVMVMSPDSFVVRQLDRGEQFDLPSVELAVERMLQMHGKGTQCDV